MSEVLCISDSFQSGGGGVLCNWNSNANCFDNAVECDSFTAAVDGNNLKITAQDEYEQYTSYMSYLFNANKGTLWVYIKFSQIPSGADSNEFFEIFKDWNNCIRLMLDQYGKIHGNFRANNGSQITQWVNTPANTISANTWYQVGYTWDCANNKHAIVASPIFSGSTMQEQFETITWGSDTPTKLTAGTDMCPFSDGYALIDTFWIGDDYKMSYTVGTNCMIDHNLNIAARLIELQQQQLMPPAA